MSFVAVAIGGAAVIGAGASIYAGQQSADAAKAGSAAQVDAINQGNKTSVAAGMEALAYLDPFRATGLRAGTSLEDALYSPEQRASQIAGQRAQLEGEVARLKALVPRWEEYPNLVGKNASERKASQFTSELNIANTKVREAQAKLTTFNKQVAAMPAASAAPTIQESPWYQFQAELLGRSQDRAFAARGLTGSGFEAEERRRGLIELGAGETERQFGRLKGLYDVGANAATVGAGAITGTGQSVSNNQVAAGNAQANGMMGVAGANRDMVNGVSNAVTGAVGTGLSHGQFERLIASNKPAGSAPLPTGTAYRSGFELRPYESY
jgi:hypothetical protein